LIAAVLVVFRGGFASAAVERQQAWDSAAQFVAITPHQTPAGVLRASAPVIARNSLASSMSALLPARDTSYTMLTSRVAGVRRHSVVGVTNKIGLRGYDAAAPPFGL